VELERRENWKEATGKRNGKMEVRKRRWKK
jgi:hypothetical protein